MTDELERLNEAMVGRGLKMVVGEIKKTVDVIAGLGGDYLLF